MGRTGKGKGGGELTGRDSREEKLWNEVNVVKSLQSLNLKRPFQTESWLGRASNVSHSEEKGRWVGER